MALFKVDVTPIVFGNLDTLLKEDENPFRLTEQTKHGEERPNFVTIMPGNRRFDGNYVEIALTLKEVVERTRDGQVDFVPVDRSMLDKLCDFLGIFPRSGPSPLEFKTETMELVDRIIKYSSEIQERGSGRLDAGFPVGITDTEFAQRITIACDRIAMIFEKV